MNYATRAFPSNASLVVACASPLIAVTSKWINIDWAVINKCGCYLLMAYLSAALNIASLSLWQAFFYTKPERIKAFFVYFMWTSGKALLIVTQQI